MFTWWFGWEVNVKFTGCFKEIVHSIYLLSFKLRFAIYLLYLLSTLFSAKEPYNYPFDQALHEHYLLTVPYDLLSTLCTHDFKLYCSVKESQVAQEFYKEDFCEGFTN